MIDIREIVYETVRTAIAQSHTGVSVFNGYVSNPSSFPCVYMLETSNRTYRRTQDDALQEHHAQITWECNVFATPNDAYEVFETIDVAMQGMKFTRDTMIQIPNSTRTLYRLCGRYTAIVSEAQNGEHMIYRR